MRDAYDPYNPYATTKFPPIDLLCGNVAYFDHESGMSHRCNMCGAVLHSVGMPKRCKDLYDMEDVVKKLKGTVDCDD